jgi:hypothetical protein
VKTCESRTRDEGFFLETLVVQRIWGKTGIIISATLNVTVIFTRRNLCRRRKGKRWKLNRILQHERAVEGSIDALRRYVQTRPAESLSLGLRNLIQRRDNGERNDVPSTSVEMFVAERDDEETKRGFNISIIFIIFIIIIIIIIYYCYYDYYLLEDFMLNIRDTVHGGTICNRTCNCTCILTHLIIFEKYRMLIGH